MEQQLDATGGQPSQAAFLAGTLGLLASVGFVVWKVGNPYLLASAVTGTPLWKRSAQQFDPLAILEHWEREAKKGSGTESLQSLTA